MTRAGVQRVRRLAVPVHAVEPNFKVLIYPHRQGDPLPETVWDGTNSVTVPWPEQKDRVEFAKSSSGKTNLKVSRGGETLISVDKQVKPIE
jgi:hypothetical protein